MIVYRAYRNGDPPALWRLWQEQPRRGTYRPITTPFWFDHCVLSKSYFDHAGLIVALDGDTPIGFAHAGFGPNTDGSALDPRVGTTSVVCVAPHPRKAEISRQLLTMTEAYLRVRGARQLGFGPLRPVDPFYLGLLDVSCSPGVLASDGETLARLAECGYREIDRHLILRRTLHDFRAPMDRQQAQLKRNYNVEFTQDPPAENWWEACTLGQLERTLFTVHKRGGAATIASASFWDAPDFGPPTLQPTGLLNITLTDDAAREGLGVLLLGEALKTFHTQGSTVVETQISRQDSRSAELLLRLGFQEIDQAVVLAKDASAADAV